MNAFSSPAITSADPVEPLYFPKPLQVAARVVSYLLHPLFVPLYVGWFFVYVLRLFPAQTPFDQVRIMATFFVSYTLLPMATVLLAKGLGFISTIYLRTQKDRIIPYMATMVFYFWVWYVFKNQAFPVATQWFSMAVFLSTCLGVFFNNYLKVSMHGLSVGVVLTLLVILALGSEVNFGPYLSVGFLLGGLVCTARLVNNDHRPAEVYAGLLIGCVAQLTAWAFI